jgi:hypothetical protein
MYDLCLWMAKMNGVRFDCLGLVWLARRSGWYGQESEGWRWPVVTPEPEGLSY